jgi:hypothetical protein
VRGVFQPNPIIASLSMVVRLGELAQAFGSFGETSGNKGGKQSNRTGGNQTSWNKTKQGLAGLINDIEPGTARSFIVEATTLPPYKAVITLFTDYLRDQSATELTNKEFRLFGKVIKVTPDSKDSLDLLSGTAIGSVKDEVLESLFSGINNNEAGLSLPKITRRISGPVIQIVPIAIYI